MGLLGSLFRSRTASAAAEMALVTPLLLILMMGSFELGNYFMDEHALLKQVRNGARYASRLPLDASYSCTPEPAVDPDAEQKIINVTRTGSVAGGSTGRIPAAYWDRTCLGEAQPVSVTLRCMPIDDYPGLWRGRTDDIPVVSVAAAVQYRSVLSGIGFNGADRCIVAESEIPAVGL